MSDKPNILILMSDQHNRKLCGCYGNKLLRTPNIDRLASSSMTFTNAYCPAPLCVPSRMSFMTGYQPAKLKIWTNSGSLPSQIPCWPHYLGLAGYECRLIGRMHFVGDDQRHGFLRNVGEIAQPVDSWSIRHEGNHMNRKTVKVAGKGLSPYLWYDRQIAAAACDFLKSKALNGEQPFAAVAGFLAPHNPYVGRKELFDYYYERVDIPDDDLELPESINIYKRAHGFDPKFKKEQIRRSRAAYFALCEEFDGVIGSILDCLEQTGLADNTVVMYVSDHGDMAGEKGCWTKGCYYEGSAGVPMIIRAPGITKAGSICENVVNLYDIAPTLCDIAGASPIYNTDGRSLVNLLRGNDSAWKDETFSELFDIAGAIASRMIRRGNWKLWQDVTNNVAPALFDLSNDPEELNDLGSDVKYEAVKKDLLKRLHENWTSKTLIKEAPLEGYRQPSIAHNGKETLGEWDKIIAAWRKNCAAANDHEQIIEPCFPAELDSPYQAPA